MKGGRKMMGSPGSAGSECCCMQASRSSIGKRVSKPDRMATLICPIYPEAHPGGWALPGGLALKVCCRGPFLLC